MDKEIEGMLLELITKALPALVNRVASLEAKNDALEARVALLMENSAPKKRRTSSKRKMLDPDITTVVEAVEEPKPKQPAAEPEQPKYEPIPTDVPVIPSVRDEPPGIDTLGAAMAESITSEIAHNFYVCLQNGFSVDDIHAFATALGVTEQVVTFLLNRPMEWVLAKARNEI